MNLKDKILNKIADRLKDYRTPEYDRILSCSIKGEVKGAFMTTDCTTVKELTDKSKKGMIDIGELLDQEFDNSETYHHKAIIFCDKDNIVCLYNSKNNSYYEDVHEFFERAEERVYIKCDSNSIYETFKNFVNQSSKYHEFVEFEYEIPRRKAFETIFSEKENTIEKNVKENKITRSYENSVQITGKLSNIGKEFTKKDGSKAQFIEIEQEYEYNDRIKYNKISVMLPDELIGSIRTMGENDTISIKGKLSTYNDKNNNLKSVINCTEIDVLENFKEQNNQEEMER